VLAVGYCKYWQRFVLIKQEGVKLQFADRQLLVSDRGNNNFNNLKNFFIILIVPLSFPKMEIFSPKFCMHFEKNYAT